jgi:hypothetical protein
LTVQGNNDAFSISPLFVMDVNGLRTMMAMPMCMLKDLAWLGDTEWNAIMGATPAGVRSSTATIGMESPEPVTNRVPLPIKGQRCHLSFVIVPDMG